MSNQQPGSWQNPQGGWQGQPNPPAPQAPRGPQYSSGPQQPYGQPPHPPTGQQPFGGQAPYGQGPQGYGPGQQAPYTAQGAAPVATKKKSKAPALIAAVVALVLVAGGGFVAWSLLRGSTPAAAQGIPSSALGVIEINLNPAAADQLALKEFVEKFPSLADDVSDAGSDYKLALWELLTKDAQDAPDYETEIKPWLGDSIAIAATGSMSESSPIISVQVKDKSAAQEFVDANIEEMDGATVEFLDDLMIVRPQGEPIDVDAIKAESLADTEAYQSDMSKLGGGWLLTGWAGEELFRSAVEESGDDFGVDSLDAEIRVALGAKVEDGTAVARTIVHSDEAVEGTDVDSGFVTSLPGDALGALGYALSPEIHQQLWDALASADDNVLGTLAEVGINSAEDLGAVVGDQGALVVNWSNDMPQVGLKIRTQDPAKHQQVLETLASASGLAELKHQTDGDLVHTTFGMNPDALVSPATELADNETFKKLVPETSSQLVLFVDVQAILGIDMIGQALGDDLQDLRVISGIGISGSNIGDGYAESFIRVGTR